MIFQVNSRARGFTLIEIMLVTGITLLLLGWGVPNMLRALEKHGIAKATMDIMDGCKQARALAILKGIPAEFVLTFEGDAYRLRVSSASRSRLMSQVTGMPSIPLDEAWETNNKSSRRGQGGLEELDGFKRVLDPDIALETIDVNFIDQMQGNEARVRFFPNGTSDEFTTTVFMNNERRIISLDPITGIPSMVDPKYLN
ncbi:MAG: prepilin-type N-terminal cleavage/methylation domain-containing protein [Verrucomicrobiota bacterium]|jgi:prepilin-type N-terminal cleavage/methylation domain-containing protein|nr:prepilin-type N-terminal cleavage/methylation domain-containing protein [Verrucomicrobiota bacterium]